MKKKTIDLYKDLGFLKLKPIFNFKKAPYKVGDHRTLPKGTEVWSIEYQTMISFPEDQIIEVTHTTCYGDLFFGKLKQVIFQHMFPGIIGKGIGEIETYFSKTTDFTIPEPGIFVQQLIKQQNENI